MKRKSSRANPCCDCQTNAKDCVWLASRGILPVDGWQAERVMLYTGDRQVATYHIEHCPLYRPPKTQLEYRRQRYE